MGILDNVKNKAQDLVSGNRDKIEKGLEKAGEFADSKTHGKHADKIDKGLGKVKEGLDKVAPDTATGAATGTAAQTPPPNPVAPHPSDAPAPPLTPTPPVTPAAPRSGAPDAP
ncbi:MAG: antitoxin [Sporichthyaceae bacterium]